MNNIKTFPELLAALAVYITIGIIIIKVGFFIVLLYCFSGDSKGTGKDNTKYPYYTNYIIRHIDNHNIVVGLYKKESSSSLQPWIISSKDNTTWLKNNTPNLYESNIKYDNQVLIKFHDKCYVIGIGENILVSDKCESTWTIIFPKKLNRSLGETLSNAKSGVIATDGKLYITNDGGVYSSLDGETWKKETLPLNSIYKTKFNNFNTITYGNNKVITSSFFYNGGPIHNAANINQNSYISIIYTLDIPKQKWSTESFIGTIDYIQRGKDRFVGITSNATWILADGNDTWTEQKQLFNYRYSRLIYESVANQFIINGDDGFRISLDGINWLQLFKNDINMLYDNSTCYDSECLAIQNRESKFKIIKYKLFGEVESYQIDIVQ